MLEETLVKALREALGAAYQILVLSGTATDGSGITLVDTGQAWGIDEYKGDEVRFTIGGVAYRRAITSNTATELTFPALPVGVVVTSGLAYEIWRYVGISDLSDRVARELGIIDNLRKWGGTALTGRDISLDLKALTDDSIKGLLKSIGDVAALENLVTRIGQTNDAIVAAGATGSIAAKLRRITQGLEDLKSLIVLAAGTNIIGKVGIDQTTPGTTDRVTGNIDKWAGTALTGRDISSDLANLDLALTALRDALRGASTKDFTTLETELAKKLNKATTPTKYALAITNANTEYSQSLPANTKQFSIHLRDMSEFRLAYETGKVATPTDPYETVPAGSEKYVENIEPSSLTLYIAAPAASKVAEIEAWS